MGFPNLKPCPGRHGFQILYLQTNNYTMPCSVSIFAFFRNFRNNVFLIKKNCAAPRMLNADRKHEVSLVEKYKNGREKNLGEAGTKSFA